LYVAGGDSGQKFCAGMVFESVVILTTHERIPAQTIEDKDYSGVSEALNGLKSQRFLYML
jgi:hypothetical protein